jgi:AAA family ATP:ADP antiporter
MSKTASSSKTEFTGWRAILWPVHNDELKKFLPMAIIMFCILFNYTVLRDTKDTLIVTARGSGAEAIPFLKLWGVTPSAVLFLLIYAKMSNVFSKENLFYATMAPFIVFFGAFAFILYPNRELIHPAYETVLALKSEYPRLQWLFPIYGCWTYSLFYILSELWGSSMIALLFWQFANEITRINEAKRFYALFGMLANVALIFSGYAVKAFSEIRSQLPPDVDAWGVTLNGLMSLVVVMGLVAMGVYRWMHKAVLTDPKYYDAAEQAGAPKKKGKKPKLSIGESFKYLITSKTLGYIAILVIGYGATINLCEGLWKSQIKLMYPNENDYNAFMGQFSMWTGTATILMMIVGGNILRRFGWFTGAIITPLMVLATGLIFFICVLMREGLTPMMAAVGITPIFMAVIVGQIQNIMSKSTKYSLFDPTKEMAYIPLDQEIKVKGKAAVDVVGGRLGKSSGAAIQQTLLIAIPGASFVTIAPYVAVIFAVLCVFWMYAVKNLNLQVIAASEKKAA